MAVKSLHQFFYYHSKYLNTMKCQEISMGPSIHIIQCRTSDNFYVFGSRLHFTRAKFDKGAQLVQSRHS
jgi:hypothetical protein